MSLGQCWHFRLRKTGACLIEAVIEPESSWIDLRYRCRCVRVLVLVAERWYDWSGLVLLVRDGAEDYRGLRFEAD